MLLCLKAWRIEILADSMHMQLAVNKQTIISLENSAKQLHCKCLLEKRWETSYATDISKMYKCSTSSSEKCDLF